MPPLLAHATGAGEIPATACRPGERWRAGSFRFHLEGEKWEWSAEAAALHGYGAVAMSPTTEQVLSHGYRAESDQAAGRHVFPTDLATFHVQHRIVDACGRVRDVIVAGSQLRSDTGDVIGTHGVFVDVSPSEEVLQRRLTEAVADLAADRALIEQAKGMLGAIYGITADAAFDVLRWRSQATNTKLRAIATRVAIDFRAISTHPLPARSTYDDLLLTAHERVT